MGQIIGRAAKPDACNLRSLSSYGTPAAGQHILVSTDNSAMQNGQGNFDAYVVGDGTTAATGLPLIKTYANDVDNEPTADSDKLVKSGGVVDFIYKRVFSNENSVSSLQDTLEQGSISGLGSNSWTYSGSTTRIRTKEGTYLNLSKGDVISLTDYTNARMYIGCDEDYTKGSQGWLTNDFTVPADGRYVVLMDHVPEETVIVEVFGALLQLKQKSLCDAAYHNVDDTPTAGSDKLVQSDGVKSELLKTEVYLKGNVDIKDEILLKYGYIDNNGIIKYASTWLYGVIKLYAGQTITITNTNVGSNYPSLGIAANGSINVGDSVEVLVGRSYTATEDIWIVISAGTKLVSAIISIDGFGNIRDEVEALGTNINNVQNEVSSLVGIKNYIEGKNFNESGTIVDSSYAIMSNKIPAVKGDIVVWTSNNEVDYSKPCFLQEYAADDTKISTPWRSTLDNNPAGTRTLEVDGDNTAYIVATFFDKDGYTPKLTVNGVKKWTRTENGRLSEIEDTLETLIPSDNEHGVIGENYPEQMYDIFTLLNAKLSNRLHFIHVSDNHGNTFGYAENFLDYSPAKFLINTGDLVADKFTDNKNITIEKATAASKPEYLILGNHDYSHATSNQDVFDAFFGDKDTEGTVNYHNSQVGGIVTDKTYYKVDFDDEKVKCIMLDMNDGWSDSELPNIGPSTGGTTDGKMTQTQINWFVSELADAISKNYHVCAFIHTLPFKVDDEKNIANFTDYIGGGMAVESTLTFLADIVDAFIEGGSFNFTYNGNNYTGSFSAKGHFVSWFCGHTHWDIAGKMYNHNNQFMINVCRPFAESYKYQSSYDGDRLGIHWNYVTVDTGTKRLSIYRVGQQDTIYATKRKGFSIIYK